jgi:co-chaperonin GroES (HSP10)
LPTECWLRQLLQKQRQQAESLFLIQQKGTVVAVGNGKKDEPLTVKVGDTVLYGKYAGTELQVDGKEFLIMKESDIYAIV